MAWLAAVVLSSTALAQASSSVLTGTVVDASTRAPVADVVVTATSPNLQGEQVVVTDATGLYRIPQLPPGVYTLRFEKESYRPYSRSAIDVAADRTLRLNVELLPDVAGTETVTVVGTPPVIDVGSSATGTTITQDFVRNLAVSRPGGLGGANRSFDSLATTAPQANTDIFGTSINGTTSPENLYLIDGISVNNPAYGTNGSPLTAEFFDEVNVITGGYMPEYGRSTGGAISGITKTGGNEFHGSVFGTFSPGSFTGTPAIAPGSSKFLTGTRDIGNIGDFGATLGGYILKDRLWFFAGVQWSAQRLIYGRTFNAVNGTTVTPIANSTQHVNSDERAWNYIGKLTYLINPDHRVSLQITGTPTSGGGATGVASRIQSTSRAAFSPNLLTAGNLNFLNNKTEFDSLDLGGEINSSFLDKKLLLDTRVGWHHQIDSNLPADGSEFDVDNPSTLAGLPSVRSPAGVPTSIVDLDDRLPKSVRDFCAAGGNCGVTRYFTGGLGFIERIKLDSFQLRSVVTYLLTAAGHHVLKAGFEGSINEYEHDKGYTGGAAYYDAQDIGGNAGDVYEARRFGFLSGPDTVTNTLKLANKSRSTVLGGFVQDSWTVLDKVTLNLGVRYDALTYKGGDGVTRLSLKDQWSPRVGVVWDPTQQGRSKLFVNYGRYYEQVPLDIADRGLSTEAQVQGVHTCRPTVDRRTGCDANTSLNSSAFLGNAQAASQKWVGTGTPFPTPIDPDLKSASNDEIVAGGEYEIFPNARAGLTYTYRNLVRTIEDMSNTDGQTYFIGNPGEGIGSDFPKAKRTYHAVTLQFSKSFADLWLAQVSYTWARLRGNYDGLYNIQGGQQLDPNANSTFDLKSLLLNQDGPLNNDVTHFIKAYVAKEFVIGPVLSVTLGASANANSGTPFNYLGAHPIYGPGQAFLLQRGSGGRLPWITSFDARLGVNYRISKDSTVTAGIEGFNLLNTQHVNLVDENYTNQSTGVIPGATPGNVPRQFGGVCGFTAPSTFNCGGVTGNGSLPAPGTYDGSTPYRVLLPNASGTPVARAVNLTWGKPTGFQAVRQFRFSLRVTF